MALAFQAFQDEVICEMRKRAPSYRFIGEGGNKNQGAMILKFVRRNEPVVCVVASGLELMQHQDNLAGLAVERVKSAIKEKR